MLHLLIRAHARAGTLPEGLAATIRSRGWVPGQPAGGARPTPYFPFPEDEP